MAVLVLAAACFAFGVLPARGRDDLSLVAYDFYGQLYPYLVHAGRSLRAGGGLLWNPYQDCGQPFFGNSQTGLLYPVNVVFALLPREPAFLVSILINLSIAGAGMFALGRTIGLTGVAALCGALAFQLGWAATTLAGWSPTHLAPFAWLSVAMWRTERLIRAPSLRGGLWLGLALAIQLLPGFPQTVFFTYQLIALRVVWAVLFRQIATLRVFLPALAVGLVAPVLLDAVQLLPALEVARESVRQGTVSEARLGARFGWAAMRQGLAAQIADPGNAFIALLALFGTVAARRIGQGAQAAFYALVAALYFVLSLGPGSILFSVYAQLPLGSAFRAPARLLWVTNFAVAVLVGLGSQALCAGSAHAAGRSAAETGPAAVAGAGGHRGRYTGAVVAALAVAVLLYLFATDRLRWIDVLLIVGLAALLNVPAQPRYATAAALALPALIFADTLFAGRPPAFGVRAGDVYGTHAAVFDFVRSRLTPQDRVLIVGGQPALNLMPKSATLFGIPNIHDYDALASQRYAEYFTFMRSGRPMRDFEDWYWIFDKLLPRSLQRPMFDATAARFIIVAERLDATQRAFRDPLDLVLERQGVRVYENRQALPRARYVGRIQVRSDGEVLPALADGALDSRREAVVSAADAARLRGVGGDGTGTAEVVVDEPERVVVRVDASAPGFLFLADEYFPGWSATVNGTGRDIVPANHTFRLVEVPAGASEVVFTYRPRALYLGAAITLASVVVFAVLWRSGRPAAATGLERPR
jgi:hypothetical protein